jgi:hypothetical protein
MNPIRRRDLLAFLLVPGLFGKDKDKKKRNSSKDEHLGLISGSVFQSNGLSLPGASITVTSAADPKLRFKTASNWRGEFSVRAPAGPTPAEEHQYSILVKAKGFQIGEKTVGVYEAQRTAVNIILSPE